MTSEMIQEEAKELFRRRSGYTVYFVPYNARALKREIEILQRAINPNVKPAWKKQAEEIEQVLIEWEKLTPEEKATQNAEAVEDYKHEQS